MKLIAAIGGADDGLLSAWSTMANGLDSRNNFAQNVLSFLQKTNLNGIGKLGFFGIIYSKFFITFLIIFNVDSFSYEFH